MIKIVLLSIYGVPISSVYLKTILKAARVPVAVLYERNDKVRRDAERIYRERFGAAAPVFEPAEAVSGFPNLTVTYTDGLNQTAGIGVLKDLKPDLLVLAGSGIVKKEALAVPVLGTLNCHPGVLPRYRGCTCVEWALYEDEPVGATCHFATEEIDCGDILAKAEMPVFQNDTYEQIRLRMFQFQADLMAATIARLAADRDSVISDAEKFDRSKAAYYKPIPEDKMQAVLEKIRQGTYRFARPALECGSGSVKK